jgi:hypothetical protein
VPKNGHTLFKKLLNLNLSPPATNAARLWNAVSRGLKLKFSVYFANEIASDFRLIYC